MAGDSAQDVLSPGFWPISLPSSPRSGPCSGATRRSTSDYRKFRFTAAACQPRQLKEQTVRIWGGYDLPLSKSLAWRPSAKPKSYRLAVRAWLIEAREQKLRNCIYLCLGLSFVVTLRISF